MECFREPIHGLAWALIAIEVEGYGVVWDLGAYSEWRKLPLAVLACVGGRRDSEEGSDIIYETEPVGCDSIK